MQYLEAGVYFLYVLTAEHRAIQKREKMFFTSIDSCYIICLEHFHEDVIYTKSCGAIWDLLNVHISRPYIPTQVYIYSMRQQSAEAVYCFQFDPSVCGCPSVYPHNS